MKPGRYDPPIIWRGCDWPAVILIWKAHDGTPLDLSNFTPYAQTVTGVSLNPSVTQPTLGATTMSMTKAQTAALKLGKVMYDWVWWESQPLGMKNPPSIYGFIEIRDPSTHNFNGNGS